MDNTPESQQGILKTPEVLSKEIVKFHDRIANITEGAIGIPLAIIKGVSSATEKHANAISENVIATIGNTVTGILKGLYNSLYTKK